MDTTRTATHSLRVGAESGVQLVDRDAMFVHLQLLLQLVHLRLLVFLRLLPFLACRIRKRNVSHSTHVVKLKSCVLCTQPLLRSNERAIPSEL